MNKEIKHLLDEIERLDFDVYYEDNDDYVLISKSSPCGQDCNADIDMGNGAESFIDNIGKYADAFDVSYETYLWLDDEGHGKNGAPYDMRDVYEDMEWWKNELEELANTLEMILSENED